MFKIEGTTIHLTRGDIALFGIKAKQKDNTDYIFKKDDVVRLNVFKSRDCSQIEIKKDVKIEAETDEVELSITSNETKIGSIINRPVTYWYEIIVNPDTNSQTIIGYDDSGAKEFILYPEGGDK